MSITTKRGDQGKTSLFGAKRMPKHHPLIRLVGELDELQVVIGLLKTKLKKQKLLADQISLQQVLYLIMADVAQAKALSKTKYKGFLAELEVKQIKLLAKTKLKSQFVLPGKNEAEAISHLVRVKARSVERNLSQLASQFPKLKIALPFFNRLSDYYFILSQSL